MTTTSRTTPTRAAGPTGPRRDGRSTSGPASSATTTSVDTLDETLALLGVVPVAGPPALLVVGPWVFLALMLAAPFAVLVTLTVAFAAALAVVALLVALLAAPFLLLRELGRHRSSSATPAAGRAPRRAGALRAITSGMPRRRPVAS